MCYVKRGNAPFEHSHLQIFSHEELRISDQGIITVRALQKFYVLPIAPSMSEILGVFMRV